MTSVSPVVEGGGAITPQTSCFYVMDFVLLRHGLHAITPWCADVTICFPLPVLSFLIIFFFTFARLGVRTRETEIFKSR